MSKMGVARAGHGRSVAVDVDPNIHFFEFLNFFVTPGSPSPRKPHIKAGSLSSIVPLNQHAAHVGWVWCVNALVDLRDVAAGRLAEMRTAGVDLNMLELTAWQGPAYGKATSSGSVVSLGQLRWVPRTANMCWYQPGRPALRDPRTYCREVATGRCSGVYTVEAPISGAHRGPLA